MIKNTHPSQKHRFRKFLYPAAAIIIAAALGFLMAFNYLDLSRKIGDRLQTELESRGISVGMRKLYLDPLGNIIARDVDVFQTTQQKIARISINKVRFDLNWLSWWRGQPFLNRAVIQNANLSFPITKDTSVKFTDVSADVEFKSGEIILRSTQGRLGKIFFDATGLIKLEGSMPPSKPALPEEMQKRAQSWKNFEVELAKLNAPVQLSLEFEVSSREPMNGKARLLINAHRVSWKNILLNEINARIDYENQVVKLDHLQTKLTRGGLEAHGIFDLKGKSGKMDYRSDMDLTLLIGALPENIANGMKEVSFQTLPINEGIFECDWKNSFSFFWRGTADWKDFSVNQVPFSSFHSVVSFDGKRALVSNLNLQSAKGQLSMEMLKNEKDEIQGNLKSSIDPTIFRGFFGPKTQPLLNSIVFFKEPPSVDCKISGAWPNLKFIGNLELKDFSYTNGNGTTTELAVIKSSFTLENKILRLPNLDVLRVEGEEGTASVEYDFNTLLVTIKDAKIHIHAQKFCPVFGPKLEKYLKPYRFTTVPNININGVVDLKTEKKTDLHIHCLSPEGMDYDFLGKTINFKKIEADIDMKSQQLSINIHPNSQLFDGKISGTMDIDLGKEGPPYRSKFQIEGMNFQQILITYFNKLDVTGACSGTFDITGKLDDIAGMKGPGTFKVENGDVYQIPVFGALSDVLSSIIPGVGYSKAEDARAEFHFGDGKIHIEEIDIYSLAFAVIGYGTYDYVKDDVDLSMRVNIRGLIGIPFFFVSKLFEYEGKGKLNNTKWEPKVF